MFAIDNGLFKLDINDYHAILGLSMKIEGKEVRKRYLKIAQALHPDTCKANNDHEKKFASQLLSKLVNPAYENLSKEQSRKEHQIILAQIGKRLAGERNQINLNSDRAKELFQAQGNVEALYQKYIDELSAQQYTSIKDAIAKIGQLSELNLVYLMLTQGQNIKSQAPSSTSSTSQSATATATVSTATTEEKPKNPYLRRAQEYIDKNNFAKAVLELREGLKSNPNDAQIHALLGFAYIQEKQIAMGRVHIKKALQIEPKNQIALECQANLDKNYPETKNNKDPREASKKTGGGFFGLFGGKK